ncbi:MAG: crossover junction endodeoxyribonuclease RuvC [Alphaproteobacteria bacterium]
MTNTYYIIGIDPGLVNTGWGVIKVNNGNHIQFVSSGTIKTKANENMANRLLHINKSIIDVCNNQFNDGDVVHSAIEDVFVNKNPDTSLRLGQARGVAMLSLSHMNYPVYEYQNREIKKAIVGSGGAGKEQIQTMVKILLSGAQFDSEHSADALAIAITHSQVNLYNNMAVKG